MKILALLFVGSALGAVSDKKFGCPLLTLRDDCGSRRSQCWSPGESDIDCPNNGICCFDGCANVCGIPEESAGPPPETPQCPIDYVEQEESVNVEMCHDVPGLETCTETTTQVCSSQCNVVDRPETVEEEVKCCTKTRVLNCLDLPCDPNDGHYVDVPTTETVCKKSPGHCYNNPQQVCHPEDVVECEAVESQECKTVKKQTEWPTTREECTTSYMESCQIVYKEACGFGKFKKRHHHYSKKAGCPVVPRKECNLTPVTTCNPVTTVTLEWEDVEECQPVVKQECHTKTATKCDLVDEEECIEEQEVCQTNPSVKAVFVKKNCEVPDRECSFVDDLSCEVKTNPVARKVPVKTCNDACEPITSRDCHNDDAKKECRNVHKVMNYRVPVQRC